MKSICVTGGTGSLGRRLIYYLARGLKIKRIVAFARNEFMLAMHNEYFKKILDREDYERIHFFLGDIRDRSRLEKAFFGCDVVVHAAALKRVDSILENPTEIIQTNCDGLVNALEASMATGVKKFIFISSDKAVSPENFYGASKMMGEELVRSFNAYSRPRGMTCMSCRWGNVLGSRGSIYWIWREELLKESPCINITDSRMTRYFMTFDSAIATIVTVLNQGKSGQTIIPHCQSYLLTDFLEAMINRLASNRKDHISIINSGVRSGGEKYDESLCHANQLAAGWGTLTRDSVVYTVFPPPGDLIDSDDISSFLLSSNVNTYPINAMSVSQLQQEFERFERDDIFNHFDRLEMPS